MRFGWTLASLYSESSLLVPVPLLAVTGQRPSNHAQLVYRFGEKKKKRKASLEISLQQEKADLYRWWWETADRTTRSRTHVWIAPAKYNQQSWNTSLWLFQPNIKWVSFPPFAFNPHPHRTKKRKEIVFAEARSSETSACVSRDIPSSRALRQMHAQGRSSRTPGVWNCDWIPAQLSILIDCPISYEFRFGPTGLDLVFSLFAPDKLQHQQLTWRQGQSPTSQRWRIHRPCTYRYTPRS